MLSTILAKIVGTRNERQVKALQPIVQKINGLEPEISALSDQELGAKTLEFRERYSQG